MRFIFKTTYRQDLRLFRDHFQRNWYLALVAGLLVLPILLPDYLVDFSLVLIFGLCALSLMVLAGYTGLVSLGHAAFLGIGAYAHVNFSRIWVCPGSPRWRSPPASPPLPASSSACRPCA